MKLKKTLEYICMLLQGRQALTLSHQCRISGGRTRFAKHDGAIDRFELSYNDSSYCADLEEPKQIQLQELEITKMEVSPIVVI